MTQRAVARPDEARPSVVVIGTVAANTGDAALLEAELATIERAIRTPRVTVFDQDPDQWRFADVAVHPMLTRPHKHRRPRTWHRVAWLTRLARLLIASRVWRDGKNRLGRCLVRAEDDRRALELYGEASVAFTPGGTMLVDQYTVLPRLVDCRIAIALGCRLVIFTQTIGSFSHRLERRLGRSVFPDADLVLVRGDASRAAALALGARAERVVVAPDPVFLFARPVRDRHRRNRVAISVREWPFFRDIDPRDGQRRYQAAIAQLCEHLVTEHDVDVIFVSTCQGIPGYAYDDSEVAARIVAAVAEPVASRVLVDHTHHDPDALGAVLESVDLVVATRLHAALIALCRGTPCVAISYEAKTEEVFERLGAPELTIGIEGLESSALCALVDHALTAPAHHWAPLFAAVEREREAAEGVATIVRDTLAKGAPAV
ncbi:MAG TPA: polysaccharide pyruvyl transferase family protein [Acidimicrobiia bacterium]